jgi:hypothetical protein
MEAGLGRPEVDAESLGDLGEWQPDEVVEHEDGPMLDAQAAESTFQLVTVLDGKDVVAFRGEVHGEHPDGGRPPSAAAGLGVAGADQDLVEPRLEPGGVSERAELAPRLDEGRLDGILGQVGVAEDPARDGLASVTAPSSQLVEGVAVATLGLLDESRRDGHRLHRH